MFISKPLRIKNRNLIAISAENQFGERSIGRIAGLHLVSIIAVSNCCTYNGNMNRRILTFYYITSTLFLLFVLLFAAYRLKITIDGNREQSEKTLEALRISALSVYLAEGGFDSQYFRNTMREKFSAAGRLKLLAIYSAGEGILYLISQDRSYLAEPPGRQDPGSWSGAPDYTLRPVYENAYTLRFAPGVQQDLFIDGIFQDLSRQEIYPILREILYVVLVYLPIASVFLLAAATAMRPLGSSTRVSGNAGSTPSSYFDGPRAHTAGRAGSALFSPHTGLGWNEHLPQRLSSELERAAASDQDLSVLLISSDLDLKILARHIRAAFPLRDLTFEYDPSTAAVILPDRDLDQSLQDVREFQQRFRRSAAPSPQAAIGLSARNGRLVSADRLLAEVGQALKQAESGAGGKIIAFRADPDKYRAAVAASRAGRH
jgi:hypothetical protein